MMNRSFVEVNTDCILARMIGLKVQVGEFDKFDKDEELEIQYL